MRDTINTVQAMPLAEASESLFEMLMIYPRDLSQEAPTGRFAMALQEAMKRHPSLDRYVDLTITVDNGSTAEVTFIETIRQRRKGHAGAAFKLMTDLADAFGVTLLLHAYFAKGTGARRVLDQQQLEAFYGRRGFEIIDPANKERWMRRTPRHRIINTVSEGLGARLMESFRDGGDMPPVLYHGTTLRRYEEIKTSNALKFDADSLGNYGFSTTDDIATAMRFARMKAAGNEAWGVVITLDAHALAAGYLIEPYDDDERYETHEGEWVVTPEPEDYQGIGSLPKPITKAITPASRYIKKVQKFSLQILPDQNTWQENPARLVPLDQAGAP